MKFTDIFINRPVLSIVVSLLIFVLGVRAAMDLSLRELPYTENGVVTIVTPYTGANPDLIASFITSTLEQAISQTNGIDYMTSNSSQGQSQIEAILKVNYDIDKAMAEISTNVTSVIDQLPPEAMAPQISQDVGQNTDAMYIAFYSDILSKSAITDYLIRLVQPKMRSITGIMDAQILGLRQFALRAWLDPRKLASYGLDANDVFNALANNDFLAAAGRTDGQMIAVNVMLDTNLTSVEEFKNLIVSYNDGAVVRLSDVGTVSLGSQDYDSSASYNKDTAVILGLEVTPSGNILEAMNLVRDTFDEIQEQLPHGLNAKIIYDVTDFIHDSIREVISALIQAIVIVILIIFLFLGSLRSVSIPVVVIPLSLVGTFIIMHMFGFSINILTLLAFVLAVGLVVDDAIIVVENIDRHIQNGLSPYQAAIQGMREMINPIIVITIVLISVYLPVAFMEGVTGILFNEFAFTLVGALTISAVIALTLTPMMCSRLLQKEEVKHKFAKYVEDKFDSLHQNYQKALTTSLDYTNVVIVFSCVVLICLVPLFMTSKTETAPIEDKGIILAEMTGAANASLQQTELYSGQFYEKVAKFDEVKSVYHIDGSADQYGLPNGLNNASAGVVLKPWRTRTKNANKLKALMQEEVDRISGTKIALYQPAPLPGATGLPIQFVITTTDPFLKLWEVSSKVLEKAEKSGMFSFIDNDLKLDMLQATIEIDRNKAAELGLAMSDIGNTISAALSQNQVNYFAFSGRSYRVIPQMMRNDRINYDQILNYYINTPAAGPVQLSSLATIKSDVVPESINHFQQLLSATISAVPRGGVTMGTAVDKLEKIAKEVLPDNYTIDYGGESRIFKHEHYSLLITFLFSLIIIYLCVAALFESFRDPFIILISVPMSIFGALIFINLGVGNASMNIYSEVGIITLIGLISKHGILIVQFANTLLEEGKSRSEAIINAAAIRLRPILMTTGSMVLGVIPLMLATGAGAESRFNIGLVIGTGITIGTLFTLFVVPGMYMILGKEQSHQQS